jgi:hypothetical protein
MEKKQTLEDIAMVAPYNMGQLQYMSKSLNTDANKLSELISTYYFIYEIDNKDIVPIEYIIRFGHVINFYKLNK